MAVKPKIYQSLGTGDVQYGCSHHMVCY